MDRPSGLQAALCDIDAPSWLLLAPCDALRFDPSGLVFEEGAFNQTVQFGHRPRIGRQRVLCRSHLPLAG